MDTAVPVGIHRDHFIAILTVVQAHVKDFHGTIVGKNTVQINSLTFFGNA